MANPDRIVLESMMLMRQHLPKSLERTKLVGNSTRLPIAALRSMCSRIGATWAATYAHPVRSGPLIHEQLVGRPVPGLTEVDEATIRTEFYSRPPRALIPFEHKPAARASPLTLGYLAIERPSSFDYDDLVALKHACSFAAAYAFEMMEASCIHAIDTLRTHLSQVPAAEVLPGRRVLRILSGLHRATRSHVSAYATVLDQTLCIEYKAAGSNTASAIDPSIFPTALPQAVLSTITRRDVAVWSDLEDRALTDILCNSLSWPATNPQFVLGVHRSAGTPIALWILGFERGRFFLGHPYRDVVADVVHATQVQCHHLFQRRYKKLIVNPIFSSRETRVDPNLLFALMPFKEPWSDRIWDRMIRPIAAECGLQAQRADDLYGHDIMEDIWSSILRARIVVADITSRNANVFYELGIAHTLGKDVILLTQSIQDIPFDLNRYRHIVYADNLDGYDTLTKQLRGTIQDLVKQDARTSDA